MVEWLAKAMDKSELSDYNLGVYVSSEDIRLAVKPKKSNKVVAFAAIPYYFDWKNFNKVSFLEHARSSKLIFSKKYNAVNFVVHSPNFTLVPNNIIKDETALKSALHLNGAVEANDVLITQKNEGYNLINAFNLAPEFYNWIKKHFPLAKIGHINEHFINVINKHNNTQKDSVFVHKQNHHLMLGKISDDQLIFLVHYHVAHPNDVLYHLVNILDQFDYIAEKMSVVLMGDFLKEKAYLELLQKYFYDIAFLQNDIQKGIPANIDGHPSALFTSLFN